MNKRTNQDYTIIVSITLPDCEYVLGEKQMKNREPKYVTWYCVDKNNYYHGHYIDDKNIAIRDLYERVNHEIVYRIDRLNDKIKIDCRRCYTKNKTPIFIAELLK